MIQTANNNLSVLPWYTSLEEQNHRKNYAFGNVYPLITPSNRLLPFQIMRPTRSENLSYCRVFDMSGTQVADITTTMLETGFYIKKFTDFDILIYLGHLPLGINLFEGHYYAELSDGIQTWYSDVFTVMNDLSRCLKLEWWDDNDLTFDAGAIAYVTPKFKNTLYIQAELGKPEYSFEEEGETRDGYFFPELQISEKTYKFTFIAPEYLCDVLRLVRLSDYKIITDKYDRVYNCDTLSFEVDWQEQGDLAAVNAEFQTATVVKKIGRGVSNALKGDFNDDFSYSFYKDPAVDTQLVTMDVVTGPAFGQILTRVDAKFAKQANSDLTFRVDYIDYSVDTSVVSKILPASKGNTMATLFIGEEGSVIEIVDIVLASKGEDDTTEYLLSINKPSVNRDIEIELYTDTGGNTVYATAKSAVKSDITIKVMVYGYITLGSGKLTTSDVYVDIPKDQTTSEIGLTGFMDREQVRIESAEITEQADGMNYILKIL